MTERRAFTRAIDELQAVMLVVPSEVVYQPRFTYIWTLGVGRFPKALARRVSRDTALREIADKKVYWNRPVREAVDEFIAEQKSVDELRSQLDARMAEADAAAAD